MPRTTATSPSDAMERGSARSAEANTHRPEPTGLVRPRLLAPLVAEDAPGVVVVIAPPGSGKTTLLVAGGRAQSAAGRLVHRRAR